MDCITSKDSSKSWIFHIKNLTLQYGLPYPLNLLENPLSKYAFKKLVKSKVCDLWEQKLWLSAAPLQSLQYFHPNFLSLQKTHTLWTSCGDNPFEISKVIIQAKFLSGRLRMDTLRSHFGKTDSPQCVLCQEKLEGTIEHILVTCQALIQCRMNQFKWLNEHPTFSNFSKKIICDT